MNRLLIVCFIIFSWNNIILAQTWKENLIEARNLYHQKNYDEALKKYKLVEKTAPKSISISNEIAQTAYKSNKFEAAEKNYSSSKSKNEPCLNYSKTQHNLGNSKYKQKKYQDAIDSYKESLRNNPNNEQTRYNLAKAMLSKKQDDKKENENKKKQENKKQENKKQEKQKQDKEKIKVPNLQIKLLQS